MVSIVVTLLAAGIFVLWWERRHARQEAKLEEAERKHEEEEAKAKKVAEAGGLPMWGSFWIPPEVWRRWWEPVGAIAVGALAFGVMVLFSLIYTGIADETDYRALERSSATIVTLNDGIETGGEISGHFFLGTGTVYGSSGPELAYSWYEELPGGALKGRVVTEDGYNVIQVEEFEGVGPQPHYTAERGEDPCHTPGWLNPIHELCDPTEYVTEWVIYVPKGTVAHDLTLDAR